MRLVIDRRMPAVVVVLALVAAVCLAFLVANPPDKLGEIWPNVLVFAD